MDAVDTSTMAGVIAASDRESPYYGITREDVLTRIFGEEEEEEEPVFEVAPFYEEQFVDEFQETHDYFADIGAFDPVYETPVIWEEDDGYVWLDPTLTTYEVDYWYGEG